MKGQDIVVLLALWDAPTSWTIRSLESATGIPRAGVHRSLNRLAASDLYEAWGRRPKPRQTEEFLIHGAKYVFPAALGGETRGVPTAWAAPPLAEEFAPTSELPPVWPHSRGAMRGVALEPLHPSVPELVARQPKLVEKLTLLDGVRVGDARVRKVAASLLRQELQESWPLER